MTADAALKTLSQRDRYESPWSIWQRLEVLLWRITWWLLFRPTPKHFYRWRNAMLRIFGAKLQGTPYVAPSAIIRQPRNLQMEDRACIGPHVELYNLAPIRLRARSTLSQQVYLCGGTHDFTQHHLPLVIGSIEIGEDAFIGALAFIMPGVEIGARALVGACSVVTKDVAADAIVAGNPAKQIGQRPPYST